jgi:hypothetical protein
MGNGLITLLSELRIWIEKSNGLTKIIVLLMTFIFWTLWFVITVICKPLVGKSVEIVSLVLKHMLLHYWIRVMALAILIVLTLLAFKAH